MSNDYSPSNPRNDPLENAINDLYYHAGKMNLPWMDRAVTVLVDEINRLDRLQSNATTPREAVRQLTQEAEELGEYDRPKDRPADETAAGWVLPEEYDMPAPEPCKAHGNMPPCRKCNAESERALHEP